MPAATDRARRTGLRVIQGLLVATVALSLPADGLWLVWPWFLLYWGSRTLRTQYVEAS
ncbi:MAG: hypothetical protein WD691_06885 [Acidimicrobiales bacterium]